MAARVVKLMSDYHAESPIWDFYGEVSPETVGLSAQLSAELLTWQHHFEHHFHHETGWDSPGRRQWYAERAADLQRAVTEELPEADLVVDLWPLSDSSY